MTRQQLDIPDPDLHTVDGVKYAARCFCRPADVRQGVTVSRCVRCGGAWIPAIIVHGRVDTGHYLFEAIGTSREQVEEALLTAYSAHAVENPYADADLMADAIEGDEISWTDLEFGQAARDGERIV